MEMKKERTMQLRQLHSETLEVIRQCPELADKLLKQLDKFTEREQDENDEEEYDTDDSSVVTARGVARGVRGAGRTGRHLLGRQTGEYSF